MEKAQQIEKTHKDLETDLNNKPEACPLAQTKDRPSLGIDVDYYQSVIDDPEVSEERKRELIELIGAIVINFIDIGFGVHPVQLAQNKGRLRLDEETPPLHTQFGQGQFEQFEKETLPERSDV